MGKRRKKRKQLQAFDDDNIDTAIERYIITYGDYDRLCACDNTDIGAGIAEGTAP